MNNNGPSSRMDGSTTQSLNVQHSACEVCRAKKVRPMLIQHIAKADGSWQLKCSGERPRCRRCLLKNVSCQYPLPEGRKRKTQAEEAVASRQAASAARSRRVNEVVPHELQSVFTVKMTDVTQSRAPSPRSTNTQAIRSADTSSHSSKVPQPEQQDFFALEDSDHGIEKSYEESGSIGSSSLSHDTLIDGMILVSKI